MSVLNLDPHLRHPFSVERCSLGTREGCSFASPTRYLIIQRAPEWQHVNGEGGCEMQKNQNVVIL